MPNNKNSIILLTGRLEQMLISAVRYATGRRTYIVGDTVDYMLTLLPHLSEIGACPS